MDQIIWFRGINLPGPAYAPYSQTKLPCGLQTDGDRDWTNILWGLQTDVFWYSADLICRRLDD